MDKIEQDWQGVALSMPAMLCYALQCVYAWRLEHVQWTGVLCRRCRHDRRGDRHSDASAISSPNQHVPPVFSHHSSYFPTFLTC
jgi:hypothetical protein